MGLQHQNRHVVAHQVACEAGVPADVRRYVLHINCQRRRPCTCQGRRQKERTSLGAEFGQPLLHGFQLGLQLLGLRLE